MPASGSAAMVRAAHALVAFSLLAEAARGGRQAPLTPLGVVLPPTPAAAPAPAPVATPAASPSAITGAYSLLRTSGQRLGGAAGVATGLEGSLNAIEKELKVEVDGWDAKRRVHVEERDALQKQVNHLQAILDKRKALHAEKAHILQILPKLADRASAIESAFAQARQKWEAENKTLEMELDHLRDQIKANKSLNALHLVDLDNTTDALTNRSGELQQEVGDLDRELQGLQKETAQQRLNATKQHVALSQEIQALHKEIKDLEADAAAQAPVRAKLLDENRRLAKQAGQVMSQREKLQESNEACKSRLAKLDGQIGDAKKAFQESERELLSCKDLEGEVQKVQEQLNICRAGLKSGG